MWDSGYTYPTGKQEHDLDCRQDAFVFTCHHPSVCSDREWVLRFPLAAKLLEKDYFFKSFRTTTPPFMTNLIFSISVISVVGSP
jgi:hypothetical protein